MSAKHKCRPQLRTDDTSAIGPLVSINCLHHGLILGLAIDPPVDYRALTVELLDAWGRHVEFELLGRVHEAKLKAGVP